MKKSILSFPPSREHALDSQLRFAIANKRLIRFTYESAVRVAEPHDYGVRDGGANLLVFQRQKAGRKDDQVARVEKARHLENPGCTVFEDLFTGTREAPRQRHHQWDVLYARVDHST